MAGRKKGGGEGKQKGKKTKAISHIKNKPPVAVLVPVPIICYLLFPVG